MLFTPKSWREMVLFSPSDETSGTPKDNGAADGETPNSENEAEDPQAENPTDPETETQDPEDEDPETETPTGDLDGEFDPDRAMQTIKAQRDENKALRKQIKTLSQQVETLTSEGGTAQTTIQDLEAKLQNAQAVAQGLRLESAYRSEIAKKGFRFVSPQAEVDGFDLLDLEGVKIGSDGKITGLDKALDRLHKDRGYLFEGGNGTPPRDQFIPKKNRREIKNPTVVL